MHYSQLHSLVITVFKQLDLNAKQLIIIIINNNLHLYSANLYMNIFGCALQYCYIKFMLKVTKG